MSDVRVTVSGVEETNRELERRFGRANMARVIDSALITGANVIKKQLELNLGAFAGTGYSTGASRDEITISNPMTLAGVRTVLIYWSGPKKRYTIIHLNEFGTIKNPNPRLKGAIENALRAGQEAYIRAVKEGIQRGIQ